MGAGGLAPGAAAAEIPALDMGVACVGCVSRGVYDSVGPDCAVAWCVVGGGGIVAVVVGCFEGTDGFAGASVVVGVGSEALVDVLMGFSVWT